MGGESTRRASRVISALPARLVTGPRPVLASFGDLSAGDMAQVKSGQ
jgi:hypothetical protein